MTEMLIGFLWLLPAGMSQDGVGRWRGRGSPRENRGGAVAVAQEVGDGENWLESTYVSKVELPGLDVGGDAGRRQGGQPRFGSE